MRIKATQDLLNKNLKLYRMLIVLVGTTLYTCKDNRNDEDDDDDHDDNTIFWV